MPVFMCRWPNGDFSVVKAANKNEAIEFLDEVGNAEGCPVTPIKDFMVHFGLRDDGEFELQTYGEMTREHVMRLGYPALADVLRKVYGAGMVADDAQKEIRLAVDKERERVTPRKVKEPRTLLGRKIKAMMDAPTRKIDRILEEETTEALKRFKDKGKAN